MTRMQVKQGVHSPYYILIDRFDGRVELFGSFDTEIAAQDWILKREMTLGEAYLQATHEKRADADRYQRVFELMHKRLPSGDETEMIKRRCLWYEEQYSASSNITDALYRA